MVQYTTPHVETLEEDSPYTAEMPANWTDLSSGLDYTFLKWSDGDTDMSRSGTITADTTIRAEYEEVPPVPSKGYINVTTAPVSGEVFIDGETVGSAPVTLEVDVGSYAVTFGSVSGYITPDPQTAVVLENQTKYIVGTYVVIPPSMGVLNVTTEPINGEVFVDGTSEGTAPISKELTPGSYTVSFGDVEEYNTPDSQVATILAGQNTDKVGTYSKKLGKSATIIAAAAIISATVVSGAAILLRRRR